MPTLFFIVAGATGLILTRRGLRYAMRQGSLTHHRFALILAVGLGLTWAAAFFAPLLAPGVTVQLRSSLVLFFLGHSLLVAMMTYGIVRVLLLVKSTYTH